MIQLYMVVVDHRLDILVQGKLMVDSLQADNQQVVVEDTHYKVDTVVAVVLVLGMVIG